MVKCAVSVGLLRSRTGREVVAKPKAAGTGGTTNNSVFDTVVKFEFEMLRFPNLEKSDTEMFTAQAMESQVYHQIRKGERSMVLHQLWSITEYSLGVHFVWSMPENTTLYLNLDICL